MFWSRLKTGWVFAWLGTSNAATGAHGEKLAARFLRKHHGFRILARNWRSPRDRRDEIDLVCLDRGVLVFVEVKTRAADSLISGYHAVDKAKKRVLLRACTDYLRQLGRRRETLSYRFDIVEVQHNGRDREPLVRHYENVPLFPKHQ